MVLNCWLAHRTLLATEGFAGSAPVPMLLDIEEVVNEELKPVIMVTAHFFFSKFEISSGETHFFLRLQKLCHGLLLLKENVYLSFLSF